MKNVNLGDYLLWKGKLAKVVYETDQRTVGIELINDCKCPHCNKSLGKKQIDVIPTSPLFQENAELLQTTDDDVLQRLKRLAYLEKQIEQKELLPIQNVSQQSELLLAFVKWLKEDDMLQYDDKHLVDWFLKANNCG